MRAELPQVARQASYRCSLGTNTVLGLVTNGLFGATPDARQPLGWPEAQSE